MPPHSSLCQGTNPIHQSCSLRAKPKTQIHIRTSAGFVCFLNDALCILPAAPAASSCSTVGPQRGPSSSSLGLQLLCILPASPAVAEQQHCSRQGPRKGVYGGSDPKGRGWGGSSLPSPQTWKRGTKKSQVLSLEGDPPLLLRPYLGGRGTGQLLLQPRKAQAGGPHWLQCAAAAEVKPFRRCPYRPPKPPSSPALTSRPLASVATPELPAPNPAQGPAELWGGRRRGPREPGVGDRGQPGPPPPPPRNGVPCNQGDRHRRDRRSGCSK